MKLLLITIGFYQYDLEMKSSFEKRGYDVTLFSAVAELSFAARVLRRKNRNEELRKAEKEKQKALLLMPAFDKVVVICGRPLDPEIFKEFRIKQSKAEFILYLWDDVARIENFSEIRDCFNRILTFDINDAQKYEFEFRPLYFINGCRYDGKKTYDLCFLGWAHSDRLTIMESIYRTGLFSKVYIHIFNSSWFVLKYRIRNMSKKPNLNAYVSSKQIDTLTAAAILRESKVTVDIQHPTQNGLTMRTLESLAAQTKIITTNENILQYDFYHPDNVLVIDRTNPVINAEWVIKEWHPIEKSVVENYSIDRWASDVVEKNTYQLRNS